MSTIDLSKLPAPSVVEDISYDVIFSEILTSLTTLDSSFDAILPSDPAYKILEVVAYREVFLRAKFNESARQCFLAYATDSNLEQIAALFGVSRLEDESDDSLRSRTQLSLEAVTTAGSVNSYIFHASAVLGVADVSIQSPASGDVLVTIYSSLTLADYDDDQELLDDANTVLLASVEEALNAQDVRPLTDNVTVQHAEVIDYEIEATVTTQTGVDQEVVQLNALDALSEYVTNNKRIGADITISGIHAALHQSGVDNVDLVKPTDNVSIDDSSISNLTTQTISFSTL